MPQLSSGQIFGPLFIAPAFLSAGPFYIATAFLVASREIRVALLELAASPYFFFGQASNSLLEGLSVLKLYKLFFYF